MTPLLRILAILMLSALSSAGWVMPAHAQDAPPPARGHRPPPDDMPAPRMWNSLDPAQRDVLAPLAGKWDRMPPRKQAHMLKRAEHWVTLPAQRREEIRQHIARWQAMTPAEREEARENKRKFNRLSPQQRAQLHATFQRFQKLPPAQRERLIRQWHSLPPSQRLDWDNLPGHRPLPPAVRRPPPDGSAPEDDGQR